MADQEQSTGDNSLAVQSLRDTHVHTGVGPEEMRRIIEALGQHTQIANEMVNQRLKDFEERLMHKFATMDQANPEAFKDPDFQYALISAQKTHARCGDDKVADIIVDVIAERSKISDRNRLQLTLNEAIKVSGSLTANEFAELSLTFLIKNTHNYGVGTFDGFITYLERHFRPLLADLSHSDSSYQFLESQRCAIIELTEVSFEKWLWTRYGGIFSKGFTDQQLKDRLPEGKKNIFDGAKRSEGKPLLIPCLNDPSKLQFSLQNRETLIVELQLFDLEEPVINSLASVYEASYMPLSEIVEMVDPRFPEFEELKDVWSDTPLKKLKLTSIGIAIAHSNLRHLIGFEADLSIWID